jgi:hypothetical protein
MKSTAPVKRRAIAWTLTADIAPAATWWFGDKAPYPYDQRWLR